MKSEEVKKYLNTIWRTPKTDEIDDTKSILVFLETGDIYKCRYDKINRIFYIKNKAVIFRSDIITWCYVEDIIL